jgi:hypothetical protein
MNQLTWSAMPHVDVLNATPIIFGKGTVYEHSTMELYVSLPIVFPII